MSIFTVSNLESKLTLRSRRAQLFRAHKPVSFMAHNIMPFVGIVVIDLEAVFRWSASYIMWKPRSAVVWLWKCHCSKMSKVNRFMSSPEGKLPNTAVWPHPPIFSLLICTTHPHCHLLTQNEIVDSFIGHSGQMSTKVLAVFLSLSPALLNVHHTEAVVRALFPLLITLLNTAFALRTIDCRRTLRELTIKRLLPLGTLDPVFISSDVTAGFSVKVVNWNVTFFWDLKKN